MNIHTMYSIQEIKLFKHLNFSSLFEGSYYDNPLEPVLLYRMAMEDVFIKNKQGPEVEALRRAIKAINSCNPYRMTPEFEELIKF